MLWELSELFKDHCNLIVVHVAVGLLGQSYRTGPAHMEGRGRSGTHGLITDDIVSDIRGLNVRVGLHPKCEKEKEKKARKPRD